MSESSGADKAGSHKHVPAAVLSPAKKEIERHLKDLLSHDFNVRAVSATELGKYGEDAAEAIVDSLIKKADQPHALANFSDALAEIGKPSLNVILHGLTHLLELKRVQDVYVLESFVELLGLLRDRRATGSLLEQLAKLNRTIKRNHDRQLVHCCEAAKVKIHRVLVHLGEKGGLEDLLETLGDGRKRVRDGVVDVLTRIGDRRALVPLVRLYDIEEHVSFSGAQFIKEAIREIARREKLSPDDRLFRELTPAEKSMLERILPRPKNGKH
jgi:HEAT repeat protein